MTAKRDLARHRDIHPDRGVGEGRDQGGGDGDPRRWSVLRNRTLGHMHVHIDLFKGLAVDAQNLGFLDNQFDLVFCIQNGISAFGIEPGLIINEALRVTKTGGKLLLSSYSDKFWDHRLEWFELQSKHGLIGEIDYDLSGEGKIVCKDGFEATTFGTEHFEKFLSGYEKEYNIFEIDESSIFCEVIA